MTERTSGVGISDAAFRKLTKLKADFHSLAPDEQLEFTRQVRARRIKPPKVVLKEQLEASVVEGETKPKKPRKPRVKKELVT